MNKNGDNNDFFNFIGCIYYLFMLDKNSRKQ